MPAKGKAANEFMPVLKDIRIYPIKALDGVSVSSCQMTAGGALMNDRRFMLIDGNGKRLNGKCCEKLFRVRAEYDLGAMTVTFHIFGETTKNKFQLQHDNKEIAKYFSKWLGFPVAFIENSEKGFPDDEVANGPTIVSEASLHEVAGWFDGMMTVEELIRRFRVNLIVGETEPFWEDRLFGAVNEERFFTIGETIFLGVNPCQRCIVPTRNPDTGERHEKFQQIFIRFREKKLGRGVEKDRFNHYYRFTTNTKWANAQPIRYLKVDDSIVTRTGFEN
jgi:uncharacterized protein YcbX